MKKSFFITLGIYLLLFSALSFYSPPPPTKVISLTSIQLVKTPSLKPSPLTQTSPLTHPTPLLQKPLPPPNSFKQPLTNPPKTAPKVLRTPKKVLKRKKRKRRSAKKRVKRRKVKKVKRKVKRKTVKRRRVIRRAIKRRVVKVKTAEMVNRVSSTSKSSYFSKKRYKTSLKPYLPKKITKPSSYLKPSKSFPKKVGFSKNFTPSKKFLSKIRRAILAYRYYPRIARKRRKEGVVKVSFYLLPTGKVSDLKVVKSSGYKILDKAAIITIKRASKAFPTPTHRIKLTVPIEYRLR
ncbi:MAG: energy transducer TonB [Epsilonproteobacteria bacterium]|nr:energy transducer TonB [Campylobacterota bacterium]